MTHPPLSETARRADAVIAAFAWLGLALQLTVTVGMMTADGYSLAGAVWRYLGYFTILTNLLVALVLTAVALNRWPGATTVPASPLSGVVLAIAIVGVVYDVLLSARVPAMGPLWWTADRMLHYLVPSLTVLWWIVFVPKQQLGMGDPVRWLAYPVGYLAYALARGAVDGWYPYFFIDVTQIGYVPALVNAAWLSASMLVAGYVVVGIVLTTGSRRRS